MEVINKADFQNQSIPADHAKKIKVNSILWRIREIIETLGMDLSSLEVKFDSITNSYSNNETLNWDVFDKEMATFNRSYINSVSEIQDLIKLYYKICEKS